MIARGMDFVGVRVSRPSAAAASKPAKPEKPKIIPYPIPPQPLVE